MLSRKGGSSGAFSQSGRIAGITGQSRFRNCRRKAYSSLSCQGPLPFLPTKTAADLILPICSSSSGCHGSPGRNFHSSSQGCSLTCQTSYAWSDFTVLAHRFFTATAASFLGKVKTRYKFGNLLNGFLHDQVSGLLGNCLHILV